MTEEGQTEDKGRTKRRLDFLNLSVTLELIRNWLLQSELFPMLRKATAFLFLRNHSQISLPSPLVEKQIRTETVHNRDRLEPYDLHHLLFHCHPLPAREPIPTKT